MRLPELRARPTRANRHRRRGIGAERARGGERWVAGRRSRAACRARRRSAFAVPRPRRVASSPRTRSSSFESEPAGNDWRRSSARRSRPPVAPASASAHSAAEGVPGADELRGITVRLSHPGRVHLPGRLSARWLRRPRPPIRRRWPGQKPIRSSSPRAGRSGTGTREQSGGGAGSWASLLGGNARMGVGELDVVRGRGAKSASTASSSERRIRPERRPRASAAECAFPRGPPRRRRSGIRCPRRHRSGGSPPSRSGTGPQPCNHGGSPGGRPSPRRRGSASARSRRERRCRPGCWCGARSGSMVHVSADGRVIPDARVVAENDLPDHRRAGAMKAARTTSGTASP